MEFKKEEFLAEAKELVKAEGKEHLADFIEDVVMMAWEVLKLASKHSDNSIDDLVVASMDSTVKDLIDKIDSKEEI